MNRAKITGIGFHVPERVVTNQDLEKIMNTSDEWIKERSGITERHWVEEESNASILAIEAAKNGAACLRINPGNIGSKARVIDVIKAAKDYNCSIRVGVNAGSLEKNLLEKYKEPCPEALVESALYNVKLLEDNNFFNFKLSVKSSDIFLAVKSCMILRKCQEK